MINDLKDFEKFIKICRKQGVTEVSLNGTFVKLGDLPSRQSEIEGSEEIQAEEITPEQLMFMAADGVQR